MKKIFLALFLGLFVAAGSPIVLHAEDMGAGAAAGETKETPKKTHKKHKNHKSGKKHKKAKEAAAEPAATGAGAQ